MVATPALEGENLIKHEDLNGVKTTQAIINQAHSGGGFVEYHFDNPAIEGDEIRGTSKVSYVETIDLTGLDDEHQTLIIASGIYEE